MPLAASEIWLLTSSDIDQFEGVDRVFSQVPIDSVGDIYRSCDVLVKLSLVEGMFGPPLEMFHCGGTAIVYDVTGHDEYMSHGANSLIISTGDRDAVRAYLLALSQNPMLVNTLKHGARTTAANWPSWEQATETFETALTEAAATSPISQERMVVAGRRLSHLLHAHWRDLGRARE